MIKLTLKNYRCFTDEEPATIELGAGFTAFVGPNNSGKSAFLKFFYEFQNLWSQLLDEGLLVRFNTNPDNSNGMNSLRYVLDSQEILCDFTGRPWSMEVLLNSPPPFEPYLRSISLDSVPGSPTYYRGKLSVVPKDFSIQQGHSEKIFGADGRPVWYQPVRDSFAALRDCMYAPAFRNSINEGSGSFYDFAVGTSLVTLWNSWKSGESRTPKKEIQTVTSDIQKIFGFKSLEINMSANGKNFEVITNGRPYRLTDLGSGLSQFIMLFANLAVRKPALLLIDEPETNLHPALQIDFLTSLASYTTTSSVIFATHSLGLARAVADRIFTFTPTDRGTIVTPFERTPNYAEFAGELSFSSFRELGFSTILLVEGPSEVKAVQQFLRVLNLDHRIVILHLGGSSMISPDREQELNELKRITDSVAVMIDSEKNSPNAALSEARAQFLRDCQKLGFRTHETELRAFENYLPNHAVKAIKGEKYRSLGPYEKLNDASPAWAKSENWRIARVMSEQELMQTDIGKFLASLKNPDKR